MKNIYSIFLGSLILLFEAFRNSYPLVYPDTGTYIRSGFTMDIPIDRPIFYGIFINITSLKFSLWLVIFFKG